MGEPVSDFELLDRWRQGDRQAADDLFARHFDPLYCFFRNKLDRDVDDLIQRTFLACVESRDRFRKDASFRSYLFTIARNELFAHFKRVHRDSARLAEVGSLSVADLGTSLGGQQLRREEERLLLRALQSIPLDLQIALELFYWEQFSTAELAEVLGVPQGTAKSRLRRAREALESALRDAEAAAPVIAATIGGFEQWARAVREGMKPRAG